MKRILSAPLFLRGMVPNKKVILICNNHGDKCSNVRKLEHCITCNIGGCYMCGNLHISRHHAVDWGLDIFEHLEDKDTEKADKFNRGYPAILDLEKLKCPCGKLFIKGEDPTICAACASGTCSPECHDEYLQKLKKCVFINNFDMSHESSRGIQGLRGIRYANVLKMQEDHVAPFTQCSIVSPRFVFSCLGPKKNTLYLMRGFRIYGSPCAETLDALEIKEDKDSVEDYEFFDYRICLCGCSFCMNRSPHPVGNCVYGCLENSKYREQALKTMNFDQYCYCGCSVCRFMPKHTRRVCLMRCNFSLFNQTRRIQPTFRVLSKQRNEPKDFI